MQRHCGRKHRKFMVDCVVIRFGSALVIGVGFVFVNLKVGNPFGNNGTKCDMQEKATCPNRPEAPIKDIATLLLWRGVVIL